MRRRRRRDATASKTLCIKRLKAQGSSSLADHVSVPVVFAKLSSVVWTSPTHLLQVVHSRILFAQRQELHKAIATHIENVFHSQLDQFYPYLVFHWSEVLKQQVHVPSTVAEKAVLYALKAADIGEPFLMNHAI